MTANKEQFSLSIALSGNRRASHKFFTAKSARHYAKTYCNNDNVERITLAGPGVASVIYDRLAA